MLFSVFVFRLQKYEFFFSSSVRDLNKSWFLSFGSRATQASGLWRPLNYSSQTDDWLLIHPFFWTESLIIIPISTCPVRSCKAKPSRFCTPASQPCQIKRVCQWHFEDGSPKQRGEKGMNYVRSLWILHCRGLCPICPAFQLSDKAWIEVRTHWHSTMEVNSSPSLLFPVITLSSADSGPLGFLREKLWEIRGEETIREGGVIEWDLHLESGCG